MKVLIVSSSLQMGGIERSSTNLANTFVKKGVTTHFLCIFNHNNFFKLDPKITVHLPKNKKNQRINLIKSFFRIRIIANQIKPDSILVFNKFNGAITLFSLMGLKYPVYISERASPLYKFPLHISVFNSISYFLFKPAGVIAQTEYAAAAQRLYYKKQTKIKVINNPIISSTDYVIPKKKQILAVGRLNDKMKGFDLLIESFAILDIPEWKIAFAGGDIHTDKNLCDRIKELGITDKVRFLGKIKDLGPVYAESSIFILPSRSEGFPNALVEAMANGLPCISFNIPAVKEIIVNNINGITTKCFDIQEMATNMIELIQNNDKRYKLGEEAKKIKMKLDIDIISKEFLDFILVKKNSDV